MQRFYGNLRQIRTALQILNAERFYRRYYVPNSSFIISGIVSMHRSVLMNTPEDATYI